MSLVHKMKSMHLAARRQRYQTLPQRMGMPEFALAAESFRIHVLEATGLSNLLRLCNATDFGVIYRTDSNQPIAVLTLKDHDFVLGPSFGMEDSPLYLKLQHAVYSVARELKEEFRQ